ncbi:MAG TPA: hypothetical protein VEA37_00780 [Flavobacterium sp.]|nr:hypothetical protein [Flavobacterium sp.]
MASAMLSREAYERFMEEIQRQIDDADKTSKEKAQNIINSMTQQYNNSIQERMAYELQLAMSEARAGNLSEAERHKIRAKIYQSVLGVTGIAK